MQKTLTAAFVLALAVSAGAQTRSTLCQATEVGSGEATELRLVGCGEGYPDNLLWPLDRADSATGALDTRTHAPATGKGAVVYVMDTGVWRDHDEFARAGGPNVIDGILVTPWPQAASDCPDPALHPCAGFSAFLFGHGTGVASVIAGIHNGVAPDAKIVSVAVQSDQASVWISALDQIIRHAWAPTSPQFRTAVVNMSSAWGLVNGDGTFRAFANADHVAGKMRDMIGGVDAEGRPDPTGKRFLFTTIAGNDMAPIGNSKLRGHCTADGLVNLYPAIYGADLDGLITVGGIDRNNEVWPRSCGGPSVDILAPADDILVATISQHDLYRSHVRVSGYPMNSGTSYAAPFVAGLAACMLERNPNLSPVEIEQRLKACASHVTAPDGKAGGGRVAVYDFSSAEPVSGPRRRAVHR